MTQSLRSIVAALGCVIGFVSALEPAHATPITYNVSVASINGGPFAGQTLTGTFTFDSSIIPASGTGIVQNPAAGLGLLDLSINFGTLTFDETNADASFLIFSGGLLTDFFVGGDENGIDFIAGNTNDFFISESLFAYETTTSGGIFFFTNTGISFGLAQVAVPEPGTLALFGAGLLGLLALNRRRRASTA